MVLITNSLMLDTAILTSLLIYLLYKYATKSFDYWQQRGVQSIKPIPFLGNFKDVIFFKSSIGHFLADLYTKVKGDYFGIWVFGTPHLIVRSPELVKNILVKDFNYFYNRTIASHEEADPIVSKVLFAVPNPDWKSTRTRVTPVFTSGKLKNMMPLINECSEDLKNYLTKMAKGGKSIEAKEICAKFTTDVITSCAFGVQAESFKHENAVFREIGKKMFNYTFMNSIRATSYFFAPSIVKFFKLRFFDPSVNPFLRDVFWDTIKQREKTGNKRNDLIDAIIEMKKEGNIDGIKFEGDAVVAQAVQFFAAGFETTSSTIGFTLYEMCLNNNVQTRLRKEINSAVEKHGGYTYEAIQSMKYLNQVISEVLRKYPVLPFMDRRCMKDYKVPNSDLVIEKGTPVYIPLLAFHYDPQYFSDPHTFDPERFSDENVGKITPYTYLPFGQGPHNCIGERFGLMTTKLGIIQILSHFIVEQTEDTPVPIVYDPKSFVLQSNVGLPMRFVPCDKNMSAAE